MSPDDAHDRAADHLERIATRRAFAAILRFEVNTQMAALVDAYLHRNVKRHDPPGTAISIIEHAIECLWLSPIPGPHTHGGGAR